MLYIVNNHQRGCAVVFNCRAIVLLESNLGFTQLEQLLSEAGGDRRKVLTPQTLHHTTRRSLPSNTLDSLLVLLTCPEFMKKPAPSSECSVCFCCGFLADQYRGS
jgi:hypothetical protein